MTVNIIKLSVGADSIDDLARRQKQHFKQTKELIHVTRQTPRRAEDILAGGSIYWVINNFICVRQKIKELRPVDKNGISHCGLVIDKKLIRVQPRPRKAFQGWRYFDVKDAPADLVMRDVDMPDSMLRELAELGLI